MMKFYAQVGLSTLYRSPIRHTASRLPFAMCNVIICIILLTVVTKLI